MSAVLSAMSSTISDRRSLFEAALSEYEKRSGTNLIGNDLVLELEYCDYSTDTVITVLQDQARAFRNTVLGEGIAIIAGFGILLSAIKDVSASYDAVLDHFELSENFLRRLDIYTKIPPTSATTEYLFFGASFFAQSRY
ncbi:hypothetical protein EDB84DRAFT_1566769 [Lactarius hengduanensis]|nr:hypothetical protein EDB84DRAFT_1566769 [Lactarius hengduanensis]